MSVPEAYIVSRTDVRDTGARSKHVTPAIVATGVMAGSGTKRTCESRCSMSAFGVRADIAIHERHFRF